MIVYIKNQSGKKCRQAGKTTSECSYQKSFALVVFYSLWPLLLRQVQVDCFWNTNLFQSFIDKESKDLNLKRGTFGKENQSYIPVALNRHSFDFQLHFNQHKKIELKSVAWLYRFKLMQRTYWRSSEFQQTLWRIRKYDIENTERE